MFNCNDLKNRTTGKVEDLYHKNNRSNCLENLLDQEDSSPTDYSTEQEMDISNFGKPKESVIEYPTFMRFELISRKQIHPEFAYNLPPINNAVLFEYEKSKSCSSYYMLEFNCSCCQNIFRVSIHKENLEDRKLFAKIWKVFIRIAKDIYQHQLPNVKCKRNKNNGNCCLIKNSRIQFENKDLTVSRFLSLLESPFREWDVVEHEQIFIPDKGHVCMFHTIKNVEYKKRGFGLSRCINNNNQPLISIPKNKRIKYQNLFVVHNDPQRNICVG